MKYILTHMILLSATLFALSGEAIFEEKCSSCHASYIPQNQLISNFFEHNNTVLKLKAPTLNQLSFSLKDDIAGRKGDAESQKMVVEEYIEAYLDDPSKLRGVVSWRITQYFDKMPSMKGELSEDELEAVSEYIFDYMEDMITKYSAKTYSVEEAMQIAKKEGKIVAIKGYMPYCSWCLKMDREVLVEQKVKDIMEKDFVFAKVNVLTEKLPLGMKRLSTPSFYFIDSDGKTILDMVAGSGTIEEFVSLLESMKAKSKKKN